MTIENLATRFSELAENLHDLAADSLITPPAHAALNNIHAGYYRSKTFTVNIGLNLLVNAATPLLTMASKLKNLDVAPDLPQLYQDLCHEIKAFENKSQTTNYRSHTTLAARYALCALLDETILTSTWGSNSEWKRQNLLEAFQGELWGGEKFFLILQRSSEDPTTHIDLLEFLYICLSLGFEGKYRQSERGQQALAEILDDVYKIIQQQRGEFPKRLAIQHIKVQEHKKIKTLLSSTTLTLILTSLLLIIIYSSFNHFLNSKTAAIYQILNQFQSNINEVAE